LTGFGKLAPIRVRHGHNVNFVVIQQPGDVRVHPVVGGEMLRQAGGGLGGDVLAGMDFRHQEEDRLGTGDLPVGERDFQDVVPRRSARGDLVPAVANIRQHHQPGVRGRQGLQGGVGLLHRAVAGVGGDALGLPCQRQIGLMQGGGLLPINRNGVPLRLEVCHAAVGNLRQQPAFGGMHLPDIQGGRQRIQPGADAVIHPGNHHLAGCGAACGRAAGVCRGLRERRRRHGCQQQDCQQGQQPV